MAKSIWERYKTYDTSNGFGSTKEWRNAFKERMTGKEAEQILKEAKETPYTILGVAPSATAAEIKRAYYKLMQQWHPDHNKDNIEQAVKMSQKIIAAYTLLTS
jgi:DnaJ-class molecular chaperone